MGGNHGSYGDHRRLRHKASMSFACTALLGMRLMSLDDGDDGDSGNLWPFSLNLRLPTAGQIRKTRFRTKPILVSRRSRLGQVQLQRHEIKQKSLFSVAILILEEYRAKPFVALFFSICVAVSGFAGIML